jgi:hypothetical protein
MERRLALVKRMLSFRPPCACTFAETFPKFAPGRNFAKIPSKNPICAFVSRASENASSMSANPSGGETWGNVTPGTTSPSVAGPKNPSFEWTIACPGSTPARGNLSRFIRCLSKKRRMSGSVMSLL